MFFAGTSSSEDRANSGQSCKKQDLTLAAAFAAVVVLSAPVVGQIRSWIRSTFPGHFVMVVGLIGGGLLAAALTTAVVRIRDRRLLRFAAIAAAIVIAVVYSTLNASANPESNAVERFHFLEYGVITWLFYRAWRPLGDLSVLILPTLAGLMVGTAEEWLQWFIPNRVGELRDIFLNLAAILSGLLFSAALDPPHRSVGTVRRASLGRVGRLAAMTVIALAAFFHCVHLGYAINDPEIGSFLSRYAPEQLPGLQAHKAEEWKSHPPPLVLKRISREDQYLNEGLSHVRWRNRKWSEGDVVAAWNENRILEKYFAPVLDTPTYEGKQGHRWPAEQRADADARRAVNGPAPHYASEGFPDVYRWSKTVFWAAVIIVAAALASAGLLSRALTYS